MIASAHRRIRVLHVLHSLGAGGAERIVCDLTARHGDELAVGVACLDAQGELAQRAEALGARVWCTRRRDGFDARQVARLAGIIHRFRPDVVHAHQYTPYFYAALAASAAGFGRIIFTEHGRHWPDVVSPQRRAVNQLLRLRRDTVTAVCRFIARALQANERIAGRDVRVIPNGVEADEFDWLRQRNRLARLISAAPHEPMVIQVGRFHPVKDHATSLRAFAQAARGLGAVHLILVGDGPGRAGVEHLARELGIASSVHLLGVRDDVPDLLAGADVLVCSSVSEGASLSILEAMAAGLPVAATDVGGNGELVVPGQTGLLSSRSDPEALAANLLTLLRDADLRRRMGQAGRQRARQHFSQRRMHEQFLQLYRLRAQEPA